MSARIVWPMDEGRDGPFATQPHSRTAKVRIRVLGERFGYVCELCGGPVDPTILSGHPAAAQSDHVQPRDGRDAYPQMVWGNVRLVHAFCNNPRDDEATPETRRANLAQRLKDYEDRVFWYAKRALFAQKTAEDFDLEILPILDLLNEGRGRAFVFYLQSRVSNRDEQLLVVYKNLSRLGATTAVEGSTFDPANPGAYDSRLRGLLPWVDFRSALIARYEPSNDRRAEALASLKKTIRSIEKSADVESDPIDLDDLPITQDIGDQHDDGYGPDSYFAHAMQKDD